MLIQFKVSQRQKILLIYEGNILFKRCEGKYSIIDYNVFSSFILPAIIHCIQLSFFVKFCFKLITIQINVHDYNDGQRVTGSTPGHFPLR